MKVGLFFGSFNPIHTGHLIIASYVADTTDLEELWLVVTPHNPHKERQTLADDYDRLHFVEAAVEGHPKLRACDIEFELPKPSYTIDTLTYLGERYAGYEFALIMGGDNLATLHKWKNHDKILAQYPIYVYARPKTTLGALETHPNVHILDGPQIEISSTHIRALLRAGKSIRYWVPESVQDAIENSGAYY